MKQLLTLLMFLCSYVLCGAQATSLTVDNKIAGTLSQRILYDDKLTVENLTITGVLNENDLKFIQELNEYHNLTGTVNVENADITGYSYDENNIKVSLFRTKNRLNKLILPKSATKWSEAIYSSSSEKTEHLNVDSLIILEAKYSSIGGIGNPSYLYLGEGVESFYINNSEGGEMYVGAIEFLLPSTLKNIYISSSKVGTPDYITIHSKMMTIPNANKTKPSETELSFFSKGIAYVPEGTKTAYEKSIFQNLEIIAPISVKNITLDSKELEMLVGDSMTINATILPADADNKKVIWQSMDESVATVDENGVVTAVKGGTTSIEAISAENSEIRAVCDITITQPVTGISLNTYTLDLCEEEYFQLEAIVQPEDASNKNIKWTSSDISIAIVSSDGNVYAVKPGKAAIMATSEDGEFMAICKINVKQKEILVNKIELSPSIIEGKENELIEISATVLPENANNKTLKWSSTNENIAIVSDGVVNLLKSGEAIISAEATDGSNTKSECIVWVTDGAGIETIFTDKDSQIKVYDINGVLLYEGPYTNAKLSTGLYVIMCNGKTIKTRID